MVSEKTPVLHLFFLLKCRPCAEPSNTLTKEYFYFLPTNENVLNLRCGANGVVSLLFSLDYRTVRTGRDVEFVADCTPVAIHFLRFPLQTSLPRSLLLSRYSAASFRCSCAE